MRFTAALLASLLFAQAPVIINEVPTGGTIQFRERGGAVWSINPTIGSISSTGAYTAPAHVLADQTVIITATSIANPANFISREITVKAEPPPPSAFTWGNIPGPVGPPGDNDWEYVSGTVAPDGCIFVMTRAAGIHRTCNDGAIWNALGGPSPGSLAIHAGTLWAFGDGIYKFTAGVFVLKSGCPAAKVFGGLDASGRMLAGGGETLCRSTTLGETWTTPGNTGSGTIIRSLVFHDGAIWAATNLGVRRSADNGASWNTALAGNFTLLLVIGPTRLFAGGPGTDGFWTGAAWVTTGLEPGLDPLAGIMANGTVYLGGSQKNSDTPDTPGLAVSTTAGLYWSNEIAGIATYPVLSFRSLAQGPDGLVYAFPGRDIVNRVIYRQ